MERQRIMHRCYSFISLQKGLAAWLLSCNCCPERVCRLPCLSPFVAMGNTQRQALLPSYSLDRRDPQLRQPTFVIVSIA